MSHRTIKHLVCLKAHSGRADVKCSDSLYWLHEVFLTVNAKIVCTEASVLEHFVQILMRSHFHLSLWGLSTQVSRVSQHVNQKAICDIVFLPMKLWQGSDGGLRRYSINRDSINKNIRHVKVSSAFVNKDVISGYCRSVQRDESFVVRLQNKQCRIYYINLIWQGWDRKLLLLSSTESWWYLMKVLSSLSSSLLSFPHVRNRKL